MTDILLRLPDTDEMRDLLGTLGVHCVDDNIECAQEKLSSSEYCEDGKYSVADCDAEVAANEAFNDVVTLALNPHLKVESQTSSLLGLTRRFD